MYKTTLMRKTSTAATHHLTKTVANKTDAKTKTEQTIILMEISKEDFK